MNIGIYFDDKAYFDKDFRNPEMGNPGIGGTPFCFLMLAKYYYQNYPNDRLVFYHEADASQNQYPNEFNLKKVDPENIAGICKDDGIDLLVLTISRFSTTAKLLEDYNIRCIVWIHNFLRFDELLLLRNNKSAARVVFVGKEQYDRYIDDPIIIKSVCIFNMFNANCEDYYRFENTRNIVTYTGAIIPAKGFHYLAKCWKKIVESCPTAELYVMGSGALYNNSIKLGSYGIAEESYEKQFIKYLLDENGNIMPSVHFMGVVGPEKTDLFHKTRVGVVNPTARTEICPISVLEMAACGIPVVSRKKNGMPDVIENKVTGILTKKGSKDFCDAVITLLNNNELNEKLGGEAKDFINKKFFPDTIIKQWRSLFVDTLYGKMPLYDAPSANYTNNYKYLRILNRKLRMMPIMRYLPSLAWVECRVKALLNSIQL